MYFKTSSNLNINPLVQIGLIICLKGVLGEIRKVVCRRLSATLGMLIFVMIRYRYDQQSGQAFKTNSTVFCG